jgi:hypothetical protein
VITRKLTDHPTIGVHQLSMDGFCPLGSLEGSLGGLDAFSGSL